MIEKKLKYPIGRQDFASMREDGCVYVDKTHFIYNLADTYKYVFLSRPRRFGKSLLVSTMKAYFEGRKELFEGLDVMELEKEWKKHPVLHLSFASFNAEDPDSLNSILEYQFREWEEEYGVTTTGLSFAQRFQSVIKAAYTAMGEKVVVLVDEYDHALINTLHKPDRHVINRELLKAIYSNLKDMDGYIRFGFLTGVTRFSNTSIFSGLNNLTDISFDAEFGEICGFTEPEIKEYLWPGVERLSVKEHKSPEETMERLKYEYDGYHFSEALIDVYNPYSLLNSLAKNRIDNYWIQSGVPTFLIHKLNESKVAFSRIFNARETTHSLTSIAAAFDSPVAMLYQTGYLTIKDYDRKESLYKLRIPNREVDMGLFHFLLGNYSHEPVSDTLSELREMSRRLQSGDPELFMQRLQALLSEISYHLHGKFSELDFERTLFVILHVLGFHLHCELATSRGRIDLFVETKEYVYVMELKLDKPAEDALNQIETKEYALPWKFDGRKVFKIGISFSSASRNIDSWIIRSS